MSAIAGILYFGGAPADHELIRKLSGEMKRRGPDEQSQWVEGSVALGHCMLRTTPESQDETQPLVCKEPNLVLVWDGRLDNRGELRSSLLNRGLVLRSNTDAELVLRSYEAWGEDCPRHFMGDFAFAVWDAREGKLFCARDHMGARPFYYTFNRNFFAFSSEDEPLFLLPGVAATPDEDVIAELLVPGLMNVNASNSNYAEISALMPAKCLVVTRQGSVRTHQYWRLDPGEESEYTSDDECRERFSEVFGEAVRSRLRTSGDISAMMSGGMDSAGIFAMASRLLPELPGKNFHTYSTIHDQPESCIESQCIQSMTQRLGSNAHFVSVPSFTGMVGVKDLMEAAWGRPHPVDNSILLPSLMCMAAARNGHRVMLDGVSGDLTMGAPTQYIAYLIRGGHWGVAWRECRSASTNHTALRGSAPLKILFASGAAASTPRYLKVAMRKFREMKSGSPLENSLINLDFARKLNLSERLADQISKVPTLFDCSIRQHHVNAINSYQSGIVLGLTGYERVAGRYGVELRDPWADVRVVEFFVRLPLKYKVRHGWTKYLPRTAFARELDKKVLYRTGKEHLGRYFRDRLILESREIIERLSGAGFHVAAEYLDEKKFRKRFENFKKICAQNAASGIKNGALAVQASDAEALETFYMLDMIFEIAWLERIRHLG